jgi:catechol 2,3-dioxygenase-like lactoylglutathione lyase family enzyme
MTKVTGIDHLYLSVSNLARAEIFYDQVLLNILGFRKGHFTLSGEPHIQYYNRHFGYVLRPARTQAIHDSYTPGLHHLCLRVATVAEVVAVAQQLRTAAIDATEAKCYPEYAADYWATFFNDPDGIRLEVTNYRLERQQRHDNWTSTQENTA